MVITLSSCGSLWEYRSLNEMAGMVWKSSDVQHFNAEVSKDGIYDVIILFRHVHGFPYADLGVEFGMTGNKIDIQESIIIPIIGDDKEYLGEGSVDIWDVEHTVLHDQKLSPGKYSIDIGHNMNTKDLQLVMEVGIMIKSSEEK